MGSKLRFRLCLELVGPWYKLGLTVGGCGGRWCWWWLDVVVVVGGGRPAAAVPLGIGGGFGFDGFDGFAFSSRI